MTYFYSLLRFVPDPARGEFINVGAIAGDPDAGDWELRILSNLKRARAIDDGVLLPAAMSFIGELEQRLPADETEDADFTLEELRELSASMNNIVQLTSPGRIAAADAAEALDVVCGDLLLDLAAGTSHRYKNVRSAVGATTRAYRAAEVPEPAIERKVDVAAGHFQGTFDFAVHNGHAVQLAKCFSFDIPNQTALAQDIMAWAWLVHEVRGRGATITGRAGEEIGAPSGGASDLSIACVYVPPQDRGSAVFEQAEDVFREVEIDARPYADAHDVARIAAERLAQEALT